MRAANEFDKKALAHLKQLRPCFRFSLPDNIIREMNRQEYYAAMSWLRNCRRIVADRIDAKINIQMHTPEVKWIQLNAEHSCKA